MKEQAINTLLSWLTPPVFEDPEKTRIASILHVVLWSCIALITPALTYALFSKGIDILVIADIIGYLLSLGMLRLMRLGYVRLASLFFSVMVWLLMAYIALVTGGLPLTFLFVFMILISGTLIDMRAGILAAGLSFAYTIFLAWLEQNQRLPAALISLTEEELLISLGSLFFGSLMFIYLSQKSYQRMIDSMRKVEVMRKRSESYLKEKEKAEIASQAKSEFLSSMSHELRTPLNGILGYAQILKRSAKLSHAEKRGIEIIHQSGTHLLTLINDILDLSKIEARKMELYPQDLHLRSFLTSVAGIIEMRAQQKDILFVLDTDDTLPIGINADEKRLRQVLLNLLGNAVKFTHQGEVTLKVSLQGEHKASPLQSLRFEIIDTGVGMTEAQLTQIFLPFEQVGSPGQRAKGTGLGLAITQQLVNLMEGELHVESRLRKGSRFWFDLAVPVVEVSGTKEEVAERGQITGYKGKALKVLVVDDQAPNRSMLRDLLTPLGFEIREAADGQQAVALTRDIKPDLILTDLVMPVMDGFKAVEAIRLFDRQTPIIAISASVFEAQQLVSLKIGCNGFLSKPVEVEKLLALIEKELAIEWLYEEVRQEAEAAQELIPPPQQALEVLYEAAMLGMMSQIRKQVDELEQLDAKYAPFAVKMRDLAGGFEDEKIVALLEKHLNQEIEALI